jgi:hypothetical protein
MKKLILTHFQAKDVVFECEIEDNKGLALDNICKALNQKLPLEVKNNVISYEILSQCITSIEEVKEEEKPLQFPLYGRLKDDLEFCSLIKGKIYKIIGEDGKCFILEKDYGDVENGWYKSRFDLVPESEYLKQDIKEQPKYDFICPHSGEGFMLGDKAYLVCCFVKDKLTAETSIKSYTKEDSEKFAFFHKKEDAINWNKAKFEKQ